MIELQVRDRDYEGYKPTRPPRWRIVRKKGRMFSVGGDIVELFTIRALSLAIDRSEPTIRTWEIEGRMPKPLYDLPSNRISPSTRQPATVRLYSGVQLVNLNNMFVHVYNGQRNLYVKGPYGTTPEKYCRFFDNLKAVFYAKDLISVNALKEGYKL